MSLPNISQARDNKHGFLNGDLIKNKKKKHIKKNGGRKNGVAASMCDKYIECHEFHVNQDSEFSLCQTCDVLKTNIPFFNLKCPWDENFIFHLFVFPCRI